MTRSESLEQIYRTAVADHQAGRFLRATAGYEQVLSENPNFLPARNNLAAALVELDRPDDAAACYQEGLRRHPNSFEIHTNFGNLKRAAGDLDTAVHHYAEAIKLDPQAGEVRYALGVVFRALGRNTEAVRELQAAAELLGADPRPWTALAAVYLGNGADERAGACLVEALRRNPDDPDTLNLKGIHCRAAVKFDAALAAFDAAIRNQPDHAAAHYNRGTLRLLLGDLPAAWVDYEWRWRGRGDGVARGTPLGLPEWNGEALNGRSVLLIGEQGFGDTVQFIRYAPLIKSRGGRVILRCRPELHRLLAEAPGVDAICGYDDPPPRVDFYLSLLSLPKIFETAPATVPFPDGYLPDEYLSGEDLNTRASAETLVGTCNVGLVWAGSPGHENDANRSLSLDQLKPLLDISGVAFHSLQIGAASEQRNQAPYRDIITDLAPDIGDFADTAACLSTLDLLISVDTAAVHVAGALGRPAWVLLAVVPDWRWLHTGTSSAWYRSMTLFRQPAAGDWKTPVDAAARALRALIGAGG